MVITAFADVYPPLGENGMKNIVWLKNATRLKPLNYLWTTRYMWFNSGHHVTLTWGQILKLTFRGGLVYHYASSRENHVNHVLTFSFMFFKKESVNESNSLKKVNFIYHVCWFSDSFFPYIVENFHLVIWWPLTSDANRWKDCWNVAEAMHSSNWF